MTRAPLTRAARGALGAGGLAIIALDVVWTVRATGGIDVGDYLGQFTILSVVATSILMLLGALSRRERRGMVHLRAMALTGVLVAAVLHATLLGGAAGPSGDLVNSLLHIVFPVLALVEWMTVRSRTRVTVLTPLIGLAFPVVFLLGTLIRGAVVGRYPYDFVDPGIQGGYAGLVSSLAIVLVVFLAVGALVAALGAVRDRMRSSR